MPFSCSDSLRAPAPSQTPSDTVSTSRMAWVTMRSPEGRVVISTLIRLRFPPRGRVV